MGATTARGKHSKLWMDFDGYEWIDQSNLTVRLRSFPLPRLTVWHRIGWDSGMKTSIQSWPSRGFLLTNETPIHLLQHDRYSLRRCGEPAKKCDILLQKLENLTGADLRQKKVFIQTQRRQIYVTQRPLSVLWWDKQFDCLILPKRLIWSIYWLTSPYDTTSMCLPPHPSRLLLRAFPESDRWMDGIVEQKLENEDGNNERKKRKKRKKGEGKKAKKRAKEKAKDMVSKNSYINP